jgi:hypothetical protein
MSGMAGIDNIYPAELDVRLQAETGLAARRVGADLAALERDGWIRREGSVVWVIDHLTFDPFAHVQDPMKRRGVQQHVAGLPRLPIVRAFIERHPAWFPGDECAGSHLAWALEQESSRSPTGVLEVSSSNTNTNTNTNSVEQTASRVRRVPRALSAEVLQLLGEYPKRSGSDPKSDAASQIEARLKEGVPFDLLLDRTRAFSKWAEATGAANTPMVMQARRFYGQKREFETGNWTIPAAKGPSRSAENRKRGYV